MRILVVGGGPAGMSAALPGTELGAEAVLLEAAEVGGTSLNTGPAPVRTLARAARLARDWSSWAGFGLKGPPPEPDLPALLANSARVARRTLSPGPPGRSATTWCRPAASPTRNTARSA